MNRRDFLCRAAGAAALGLADPAAALAAVVRKPNVVLVMTDDQGYGDLGCHGNTMIRTPNLDRLHGQSFRLTDFHVDPTCSPTRSALMTGRYSSRVGVWHTIMGRSMLKAGETTMADVFAASGYRTGIFGKWHLGDNYPFRPQDRGFEEVLIHGGGGIGQGPDYWGNDYFDDMLCHNGQWKPYRGYCTDVFFRSALEFIERNKNRPFFAYIPTNAPHSPLNVAEKYSQPYVERGVPESMAKFYGMIENIDENIGRLMASLEEWGLAENTILIFMTDNGSAGGAGVRRGAATGAAWQGWNAGMRGTKGSQLEGGHRVPCFIRWPAGGVQGGRDIDQLAAHIDLLPTLIDLCGLDRPAAEFDGQSLAPLLRGAEADRRERILFVHSQRIETPQKWKTCAAMTPRWRLIDGEQLYDIQADPGQAVDLAARNPRVVERLRAAYEDWWAGLQPAFADYTRIVLGAEAGNPARLMAHDLHEKPCYSQQGVKSGDAADGFWAVEIAREGEYEFALRRWPEELDLPIRAAGPGKALDYSEARVQIGGLEASALVGEEDKAALVRLRLPAGAARLRATFLDSRGQENAAYYVHATRLE